MAWVAKLGSGRSFSLRLLWLDQRYRTGMPREETKSEGGCTSSSFQTMWIS